MSKPGHCQSSGNSPPGLKLAMEILTLLQEQAKPLTEKEIHQRIHGRRSVKLAAIRLLVADRSILRSGEGKNKSPYRFETSSLFVAAPKTHSKANETSVSGSQVPGTQTNIAINEALRPSTLYLRRPKANATKSKATDFAKTSCHSRDEDSTIKLADLNSHSTAATTQPSVRKGFIRHGRE